MNGEALHLIGSFSVFLLAVGFIVFLFMISPEFRKMLKRHKKLAKKRKNLKQASKAKDFQI
jgi:preprotein translocase subunit YajC